MLHFLRIQTSDSPGPSKYHLGTFLSMIKAEDHFSFMGSLLRMQSKAMGEFFFEKLKGNTSVEWARQKISGLSPVLCTSRFDEWKLWSLACFFPSALWSNLEPSVRIRIRICGKESGLRVKVIRHQING